MDFSQMYEQMAQEANNENRFKSKSGFESDERFFKIGKDSKGNGSAVVRFLPSFNTEKTKLNTVVSRSMHALQWSKLFPGKEQPEKRFKNPFLCPKSLKKENYCPVCEAAWALYNEAKEAGEPEDKYKKYLSLTAKEEYLVNVLVKKDENRPENNGKIFVFKLPKTIMDIFTKEVEKIKDMSSEDRQACGVPSNLVAFDPFNIMASRDMHLKYKDKKNVDKPTDIWASSYFAQAFTAIAVSMQEAQELVSQAYCLDEFNSASVLHSEEQMMKDFDYVMFKTESKPKSESKPESTPVQESVPDYQAQIMHQVEKAQTVPPVTQAAPEVKEEVKVPVQTATPPKAANEMSDEDFLKSLGM